MSTTELYESDTLTAPGELWAVTPEFAYDPIVWPSDPFATIEPPCTLEGNRSLAFQVAKRLLDILGTLAVLTVLAPAMLVVFGILLITTRGKPFFVQRRAGLRGVPFMMFKFRTMRPDADKLQHLVKNEVGGPVFKNRHDPRITPFGRFLRKTSLDETPQLIHVLLGQMSLVGPRPLSFHEAAKLTQQQRRRDMVKPGLTCLWQVSGRSDLGFETWIQMDLWYVKNQNLWTDLMLLWKTPMSVLTGRGAY